ncbi:MAG: hypothetical protein QM820_10985 [Minicystis sp.]
MDRAPRFGWSMAVAAALHVSAFAGLWRARPKGTAPAPVASLVTTIDIAMDPAPSPPVPPPVADAPSDEVKRDPGTTVPRVTAASRARRGAPADAPAASGDGLVIDDGAAPAPAATGAGDTAVSPAPKSDSLPPPLVPRAIRAPSAVFDGALPRPDTSGGTGAGSQIVGSARAIADTKAPRTGHGTVTIEIDAGGNVTRVGSTSPGWEIFARELQAKLSGRHLRVPSGARGVIVRLAVSADVTKAPAALTGEAKATPCRPPERDRDQAGRADVILNVGCLDWNALVPLPRHRISVSLAGEQAL